MAMRELVSGGAACAVPGSSSPANPLGALANALLGSSSKTKERLEEIPTSSSSAAPPPQHLLQSALEEDQFQADPQQHQHGSDFLAAFRHNDAVPGPQRVLSNFLHSFVHGGPTTSTASALGLSQGDKQCIRDRSAIMARHIFADRGEDFIHAHLHSLLSSLDIDASAFSKHPPPPALDQYWNESQGIIPQPQSQAWITEFTQSPNNTIDSWAHDFQRHHLPDNAWASEFEHSHSHLASLDHHMRVGPPTDATFAAMEQSRLLATTLSQNHDPKFQNSKFLQFVSKMSRGELSLSNPQGASADWASEYDAGGTSWADQYVSSGSNQWVNEFTSAQEKPLNDQWVDEFSNLQINDWADEFGKQAAEGAFGDTSADTWANAYDEYLNEQVAVKQQSQASRGVYEFSDMNPYVGHPNPLKEGQELFRKGLLSEAVLALEAEVLKSPENAQAWRLLGIAHAENDDDQQAIAAMMRAQEADPTNLEVLLALGVSHTNELEQAEALKYLYGWLRHHPKYGTLAPPELANSLYYADVARIFNDAAQMSPEDGDVHIVLGVLYNLSREYDKAIESFQTALKLKPHDYSLWNKLGATQANSVQSADAIYAYQQALDLKPNYVRAWANMGISYANQGMHEESIRYYVRALAMNPKADNAWQYLRISLSCADRSDMLEACDSRNLDVLQKEFPLV